MLDTRNIFKAKRCGTGIESVQFISSMSLLKNSVGDGIGKQLLIKGMTESWETSKLVLESTDKTDKCKIVNKIVLFHIS